MDLVSVYTYEDSEAVEDKPRKQEGSPPTLSGSANNDKQVGHDGHDDAGRDDRLDTTSITLG